MNRWLMASGTRTCRCWRLAASSRSGDQRAFHAEPAGQDCPRRCEPSSHFKGTALVGYRWQLFLIRGFAFSLCCYRHTESSEWTMDELQVCLSM